MRRQALAVAASLVLLAMGSVPALAGTYVVDQSQTNIGTSIGGTDWIFAQTFTAGMYGQVESVDLYMYGHPSTVEVSLQGVTGNPPVPDGTILGEKVLGVNALDAAWVRFNFSNLPVVNPGQTYSIFVFATLSTNAFYGSVADLYPGGQALEYRDSAWAPISVRLPGVLSDWAFRTNVDPIPVPTPPARLVPTLAPTSPATIVATAAPKLVPTPVQTPAATVGRTLTATGAPSISATIVAPSSVAAGAASGSPVATSSAVPAGSGASSGSGASGSTGSSGPGDLMLPILGAAIVLLAAGAGGYWFLFIRPSPTAG
jgi:hypothetical protein